MDAVDEFLNDTLTRGNILNGDRPVAYEGRRVQATPCVTGDEPGYGEKVEQYA